MRALLVMLGAFVGGLAAFLADIDSVVANLRGKCIDLEICAAGNHFVNVSIRTAEPGSPDLAELFAVERLATADLISSYSSEFDTHSDQVVLEPIGGISGDGRRENLPYQIAAGDGYWAPEEGAYGWRLGLPIIDVLVSEKGKAIDITQFDVEVTRSAADDMPYVQLFVNSKDFASVLLVNESRHSALDVELEFNVAPDHPDPDCYLQRTWPDPDFRELTYKTHTSVDDTKVLDLSDALSKEVPNFEFEKRRHLEAGEDEEAIQNIPEPDGYREWIEKAEETDDFEQHARIVYGRISATAPDGTASFVSNFCAAVPVEVTPGVGGSFIGYNAGRVVKLDFADQSYRQTYDVLHRVDKDESHYRFALLFFAAESGFFDVKLTLRSFERTIHVSRTMRLHIFVPRTTYQQMGIDIEAMAAKQTSRSF